MSRKGAQRYSKDVIQTAILKLEEGGSLSAISKEMGLPKTTVKYWLDNAAKFVTSDGKENGANTRIIHLQKQIADYGWKLLFRVFKKINGKIDDASFRDLVYGASELQKALNQIRFSSAGENGSTPMLEVSEEAKITVRAFLEKRREQKDGIEEVKEDLANAPSEHRPGQEAEGAASAAARET